MSGGVVFGGVDVDHEDVAQDAGHHEHGDERYRRKVQFHQRVVQLR